MKHNVVNYKEVAFGEDDAWHLTVPACYKLCLIHTVFLNLENPLNFYIPPIQGHKNFMCLSPYLFLHVIEFLANDLTPFFVKLHATIFLAFLS